MNTFRFPPSVDVVATGRRIAELRVARGLTVRDLQDYCGALSPQAIYKWQSGQALPSVDNLLALSDLLQVPLEKILVRNTPTASMLLTDKEPEGSVFLCLFKLFQTKVMPAALRAVCPSSSGKSNRHQLMRSCSLLQTASGSYAHIS